MAMPSHGAEPATTMSDDRFLRTVAAYWDREDLDQALLRALPVPEGGRPLTVDDLAPLDHFHGGGQPATARLARLGGLAAGERVLDVGGGLGGPARMLAVDHGCLVTVLDLTASYVRAGALLTERLGLGDRVRHVQGNALDLPFADGAFDVVWTQNSGMNIADKAGLLAGFARVLRPGGRWVFQEPMAGALQPPHFPVMWAADASTHFLATPDQMRGWLDRAGFEVRAWEDTTAETSGGKAPPQGASIQSLVMGERLAAIAAAGRRNRDEGRIVMIQGVCVRR